LTPLRLNGDPKAKNQPFFFYKIQFLVFLFIYVIKKSIKIENKKNRNPFVDKDPIGRGKVSTLPLKSTWEIKTVMLGGGSWGRK